MTPCIYIIAFVFLFLCMLVTHKIYLEKYEDVNATQLQPPVFEYATERWMTPRKNRYFQRFGNFNISGNRMTFSFWIDIKKLTPYWRNIFHVSFSSDIEYNATILDNLPYNRQQDFMRVPAVFITPNTYSLHICHDTLLSENNWFETYLPGQSHITMVWNAEGTAPSCTVYVNGKQQTISRTWDGQWGKNMYEYNSQLVTPNDDALLYISDRFYGEGDFAIKDFKVFNYAMTSEQAKTLYDNTPLSKVREIQSITNMKIRHPDGRSWKVDGDQIRLNTGVDMSLTIMNSPDVYRNTNGRIALLQDGQMGRAVRHGGLVMWAHNFVVNNYDFAWYLLKAGEGSVHIYNDFGGGYFVGYDPGIDRVLIVAPNDRRKLEWTLEPVPTDYVN